MQPDISPPIMSRPAYQRRINTLTRLIAKTALRLESLFNIRLSLVGGIVILLFFVAIDLMTQASLIGTAVLVLVFIYFVQVTVRTRLFQSRLNELKKFIENQEHRYQGRSVSTGLDAMNVDLVARHQSLVNDLDLVGRHSLLSLLDETFTGRGQRLLMEWMLEPKLEIQEVLLRSRTVQSLVKHTGYLRKWALYGKEAHEKLKNKNTLAYFLKDSLFPENLSLHFYIIVTLFFGYVVAAILESRWNMSLNPFSKETFLASWLWLLFFVYNLYGLKQVSFVFQKLQDIMLSLEAISPLFQHLEKRAQTKALQPLLKSIFKVKPSRQLKSLSRSFSLLSIQSHPLVLLIVNALLPWNIYFSRRAEKDRFILHNHIHDCQTETEHLEALMSLVFLSHYQTSVHPDFHDECRIEVKDLVHPLLDKSTRVSNDFLFKPSTRLVLVTGSNMAGKSTFLRAFGTNQILAHMGATVFASKMETKLVPVESCIRVSDSLREGASYFYAETKRLSSILKEAQAGRPILYFIDEVFKGTNNRERLIGSRSLIQALVDTPSLGFITTHDLELTGITQKYQSIENFHFRDDIVKDQMVFSYKIQEGPCPTTNALKIMALSGLPVPDAGS
jgi:hypothetical protein